jgi:predicted DNA-binding transcriptional regulator AlpA
MSHPSLSLRIIGIDQVRDLTTLSKTSIYTIPDFPRPVKIKGAGAPAQGGARWVESEVLDWIRGRIELRDAKRAAKAATK